MPSKKGPESRKVRRMSRQVTVALPSWVRRRLGIDAGDVVYFHRHRGGEVVLTRKEHRDAGQPGRRDLEEELTRVIAERDQFKQQALGQEAGSTRAVFWQGMQAAGRFDTPLRSRLDEISAQLAELRAYVRPPRRPHRRRSIVGEIARAAGGDLVSPSIPDPPSPGAIDGGDAALGAAPPGRPL